MPHTPLRLSLPSQILDDDARAAAAKARQLGVAGVEFPAYTHHLRLPDLSGTGRREFRHLLASQQIQLAAVHFDCGGKGLAPGADVDRILNGIDKSLHAARDLAATLLTLELGPLPEPQREVKPQPQITPDLLGALILPPPNPQSAIPNPQSPPPNPTFLSQVDNALADLGRRADRYGIPIAFHSNLSSHAALDRALRAAACPWFGLDLDPAAVLQDQWPLDETLSRLGPLVRHVRARDAVKGADRRTRPAPIGQGDVDWPELLALLDEAGYHGWLTIDPTDLPDRTAAARAGIDNLKKR
jgi:sugar phosphate isomerase/epimerase